MSPRFILTTGCSIPPATTAAQLKAAAAIGTRAGLRHVYAGNLPGRVGDLEDTRCAACAARTHRAIRLRDSRVSHHAGRTLPGVCVGGRRPLGSQLRRADCVGPLPADRPHPAPRVLSLALRSRSSLPARTRLSGLFGTVAASHRGLPGGRAGWQRHRAAQRTEGCECHNPETWSFAMPSTGRSPTCACRSPTAATCAASTACRSRTTPGCRARTSSTSRRSSGWSTCFSTAVRARCGSPAASRCCARTCRC